jgi:hypothetical protein
MNEKQLAIATEIGAERARQDAKWGQQNHPSVTKDPRQYIWSADILQQLCDSRFEDGTGAWADIALEEIAEAIEAKDDAERRAELIQLAAVVMAWIECIDRQVPHA